MTAAADRAWQTHQLIVTLRNEIEGSFLKLGLALLRMRDERLYEALGHPTFESYLGDPEVGLSRRHAYRLIGIAETYLLGPRTDRANGATEPGTQQATPTEAPAPTSVDPQRLIAVGVRKLDILRPVVADAPPDEVGRWLDTAEALSVSDLEVEVREARGLPTDERHQYLMRLARKLRDMVDSLTTTDDPAAVLDALAAACMDARARLEREGWGIPVPQRA